MSIAPGTRFGPYEVAALIGLGGMGEVYRATDTNLKRDVALKVLPESFLSDTNRLARLQREAEVLASLNHPNVAQIYGLERGDARTALVMELIDGPTLADRIAQGALPPSEALNVALQIVAALEAAHDRGIVHRDLKPANIKLKSDGTVKVLDFGIAKTLELGAASGPQPAALTTPAMTEAGFVLGTAAYMAPEQARGKPVDKRADIWSFGCVLYEMLTGRAAFLGSDVTTTLARVLEREPDWHALPTGLAPAACRTLELCLKKDAKKRLRDIGDARLALEDESAALPTAPAPSLWRRTLPVAAALVAGALAASAYVANRVDPAPAAVRAAAPVARFVVTPPETAPLANLGGYDVVISPDGKRLAYFARNPQTGSVTLYARELDSLEARLIPGTEVSQGGGDALNPFFSPDGRWVGFRSAQRGIVRVSFDGAPPLKIADDPEPAFLGAAWAADDTLIYSSGFGLHRVSIGGGTPERLTPEPAGGAGPLMAAPVLLPGGRAVLFGSVDGETERVAVLDLATGEQRILLEGGQNPAYVATGHVIFARGTTLMAAPFDAAALAVTGEPVAVVPGVRHPNTQTAADYALSSTGTLVYVPGSEEQAPPAAIVWVDRDGRAVERALSELVPNPRDPRLSPDGRRLLLTTGSDESELWLYDLGGRPPIPLAAGGAPRLGVFSPDGTRVAFGRLRSAALEIETTLADGSVLDPQPLRAERLTGLPEVWSSAGDLIFVDIIRGADILATPAAAAGDIRGIVATEAAEFDAALSPDGRWLAYASSRTGQPEVWVRSYPDGTSVRVSRNGGHEPRWSADGRELFFLQGNTMMAATVETEGEFSFDAPSRLFDGPYLADASARTRTYDVARDGRFLMIEPQSGADAERPSSFIVVLNWVEELERRVPALVHGP